MDDTENNHSDRILTAEALQCYGIRFTKEIRASFNFLETPNLPKHVEVLREEFLMFDKILLEQDIVDLELDKGELDIIPKSALLPKVLLARKGRKKDPNIELARELFINADVCSCRKAREKEWTELLINSVFKKKANGKDESKYLELTDQVAIGDENIRWNESDRIRGPSKAAFKLKQPEPDIYLGFPIQDPVSVNGFSRLPYFQNFTADILYNLSLHGLISSPTTTFLREMSKRKGITMEISNQTTTRDSIEAHHLLCFPWAIVEGKKENPGGGEIEYGRCQAANAASVSLSVLDELVKYVDVQYGGQHIPPIFAFTFVGPDVKLWIAYSAPNATGNRDHRMICIWQASIRKFWGCFQLYHIVDKLYFWAMRILKPQISGYIDQWRHRHIHGTSMLRSILTQEQNLEISEIVGRVESRLSTLGIGKLRLEDLLSQIVIQKELLFESRSTGSSADTSAGVSNNIDPLLITDKQPSPQGKKSGYSKGRAPARAGRKSAPANLITSRPEDDSPFNRRIEDPSRPSSDTQVNPQTCVSSYNCDTRSPLEDHLHAYGQFIKPGAARPRTSINFPAIFNTMASENSPDASTIAPMGIFTPEESKLAVPLTLQDRTSASRNSFGGYPAWVRGNTPPRSERGSFEEGFHFGEPAAGIFVGGGKKSIAQKKTRPKSSSYADHLKKLEGFRTDTAVRELQPITPPPRSPFQPFENSSIRQEAHEGEYSRRNSRGLRCEGGEDLQRAIEIPDSQSDYFEMDM